MFIAIITFCFAFLLISTILGLGFLYLLTEPYPIIDVNEEEKYFVDPKTGGKVLFPSIEDDWSLHLSVIVPAYNEEERLPLMLEECMEYLNNRKKMGLTFEIIIVSDGSTDKTVNVALSYARKYEEIRVLSLVKNRGKGGAVRMGMQRARGCVLLFADADGATKFSDLFKLEESLETLLQVDYQSHPDQVSLSHAIVCGSRAHLEKEETAKRSVYRLILMHGFHLLVWLLCVRDIHDTQCGFKLLTRESARIVFNALHVERWAFDVEMLYIASVLKIPMTEVAVNWTEIEGSKIVPFWSWLQMGKDLMLIWLRYKTQAWKIAKSKMI